MADVWLIRHAAYEGHRTGHHAPPDAPLIATAREEISSHLPLAAGITGIVTSPLLRARQTADLISGLSGLPVLATSELLSEWRAPSSVLGRSPDAYTPAYRRWRERRFHDPTLPFEDGESLTALHQRAEQCAEQLQDLTDQHCGSILAVSHKILMGVLIRLGDGPGAFEAARQDDWAFIEVRQFSTHTN